MAVFNKFYCLTEDIGKGRHIFGTDQIEVALTAVAPAATNTQLSNLTQISYTGLSARTVTTLSFTQALGVAKLTLQDLTLAASGTVASFRYIVLFNQTSANDPLIGWYDYGSTVSLLTGDTFTIDFDGTNGAIQII